MAITLVGSTTGGNITNPGATTHTINLTGATAGRVGIIGMIVSNSAYLEPSTPTGWTRLVNSYSGAEGTSGRRVCIYIKRFTTTESSASFTTSGNTTIAITCTVWSGVIGTGNPYHKLASAFSGPSESGKPAPSVTTTVPCMIVPIFGKHSTESLTLSGYTSGPTNDVIYPAAVIRQFYKMQTSAGATGDIALPGYAAPSVSTNIALQPEPEASTNPPIISYIGM